MMEIQPLGKFATRQWCMLQKHFLMLVYVSYVKLD